MGNGNLNRSEQELTIVSKFVRKCKTGTSPGPDGIPQSFLKQFIYQLLLPLTELFKYLRHLGHVVSMEDLRQEARYPESVYIVYQARRRPYIAQSLVGVR